MSQIFGLNSNLAELNSNLEYTRMRNTLQKSTVSGVLGSLPSSPDYVIAPSLMYQIYDAKAMTPDVINNYLDKADKKAEEVEQSQVDSAETDDSSEKWQSIQDEIITRIDVEA